MLSYFTNYTADQYFYGILAKSLKKKAADELLLYEPKNYWRRSMCEHRI